MEISANSHFETVIIGAGMSGLAAGIRLAMFGRDVLILERHNATGGLNSFYSFDGRKFDVGLHAVTNYVDMGVKGTPLGKLFRQLRIRREDFGLCPQFGSRVAFPGIDLRFTNDFEVLQAEVAQKFPGQIDNFRRLVREIESHDAFQLEGKEISARAVVSSYITDPLLADMLFCPLMYYGSASEMDMDFGQFAIMFNSIYREGFARPLDGVRRIIRVMLARYRALGGKRKMKCGVRRILGSKERARELVLDSGEVITADHVLSSIGSVETERLCKDLPAEPDQAKLGQLSFVETINILNWQPKEWGWEDTIIFFNDHERFIYARPRDLVDPRSGVICFPNNYQYGEGNQLPEGVFRVTCMADYEGWSTLPEESYREAKKYWHERMAQKAMEFMQPVSQETLDASTLYRDMFTPRTIKKYTGHLGGAVYGSPQKVKNGRTRLENVYLCGTDQGFLGIIGAMLSGISMANYHILRKT